MPGGSAAAEPQGGLAKDDHLVPGTGSGGGSTEGPREGIPGGPSSEAGKPSGEGKGPAPTPTVEQSKRSAEETQAKLKEEVLAESMKSFETNKETLRINQELMGQLTALKVHTEVLTEELARRERGIAELEGGHTRSRAEDAAAKSARRSSTRSLSTRTAAVWMRMPAPR